MVTTLDSLSELEAFQESQKRLERDVFI